MGYNKRDIIMEQLSLGKKVGEISRELGFSRSYIHQIKRRNVIEPKQSIINVTEIVKGNALNEFTLNGFNIKCNDSILKKILRGLRDDWFN